MSEALRSSAGWLDTPNIHFLRVPLSAYETDPLAVFGPHRKMVMRARGPAKVDPFLVSACAIGNVYGISRIRRLEDNTGPIRRPVWFHGARDEKRAGITPHGGDQAQARPPGYGGKPYFR